MLQSFGDGLRVAVIGASGGIGAAFVAALRDDPSVRRLWSLSRQPRSLTEPRLAIDLTDEASIEAAAATIAEADGGLDLILVATGILHDGDAFQPEKTWRQLDADNLLRSFAVNAIGPALIAKHFLPLLPRDRRSGFAAISARVGSIQDNRLGGWYGYRASKAALNQLLRSAAIELGRRHKLSFCVGLHPGTVDSALSAPFQGMVPDGKLFTPAHSAACLLKVLDGLTAEDSGGLFAWDGERIPF